MADARLLPGEEDGCTRRRDCVSLVEEMLLENGGGPRPFRSTGAAACMISRGTKEVRVRETNTIGFTTGSAGHCLTFVSVLLFCLSSLILL
jgi:hypothetical protein